MKPENCHGIGKARLIQRIKDAKEHPAPIGTDRTLKPLAVARNALNTQTIPRCDSSVSDILSGRAGTKVRPSVVQRVAVNMISLLPLLETKYLSGDELGLSSFLAGYRYVPIGPDRSCPIPVKNRRILNRHKADEAFCEGCKGMVTTFAKAWVSGSTLSLRDGRQR